MVARFMLTSIIKLMLTIDGLMNLTMYWGKRIEHGVLEVYEPPYIGVYPTSQPLISEYHNWTELTAIS
jgi:hypothetical protein